MALITGKVEHRVALLNDDSTALDAAVLMSDNHIGSVIVSRASRVIGLFTERDLMRKVITERKDPAAVTLREVMRTNPVTVQLNERCERCIDLMKENRCRHLLVYNGDAFVGIISLRDLLALLLEEKEELILQLTKYVTS